MDQLASALVFLARPGIAALLADSLRSQSLSSCGGGGKVLSVYLL